MRVTDAADSVDVIDSPLAARISKGSPGPGLRAGRPRGAERVPGGPHRRSAGLRRRAGRLEMHDVAGRTWGYRFPSRTGRPLAEEATDLSELVRAIAADAAERLGREPPRQPVAGAPAGAGGLPGRTGAAGGASGRESPGLACAVRPGGPPRRAGPPARLFRSRARRPPAGHRRPGVGPLDPAAHPGRRRSAAGSAPRTCTCSASTAATAPCCPQPVTPMRGRGDPPRARPGRPAPDQAPGRGHPSASRCWPRAASPPSPTSGPPPRPSSAALPGGPPGPLGGLQRRVRDPRQRPADLGFPASDAGRARGRRAGRRDRRSQRHVGPLLLAGRTAS